MRWSELTLLVLSCGGVLAGLTELLPPIFTDTLDELVHAATATCGALPVDLLFSKKHTIEMPHVELVQFSRSSRRVMPVASAHAQLQLSPSHTLVIYVPGWWNTPTDDSSKALVDALLNKHQTVLILDTRLSFCRGYVASTSRVKPLAYVLYKLIRNLHLQGFPASSVHLIGFSLGAHVAGITGKLVMKNLNSRIGRITALDPAKPCFTHATQYRLDRRDAQFVQVIHTSAGVLGLEQAVGHADVYVNGVSVKQPECSGKGVTLECDHSQAWKLYSSSVMDDRMLMGRRCGSWKELMRGQCSGNMTVVGYGCSAGTRGMFLYKSQVVKRSEKRLRTRNQFDLLAQLFA